jgi:copper chaperone CopZ
MHCQSCVDNLTRVLQATEGVQLVQVDLGSRTARVEHDETRCKTPDLMAAVRRAGYQVDSFRAASA